MNERLCICKSCGKSFAISDNRSICPIDNGELVDISISVNIWTKMSEEEKITN